MEPATISGSLNWEVLSGHLMAKRGDTFVDKPNNDYKLKVGKEFSIPPSMKIPPTHGKLDVRHHLSPHYIAYLTQRSFNLAEYIRSI